mgnify:CR=1 FL=1
MCMASGDVYSRDSHAIATAMRGNAAGIGGFLVRYRWAFNLLPGTGNTWFVGLFASTATVPATADIDANLNMVGWGRSSSNPANIHSVGNDGTGTSTNVDLGSSYPENTTAVYEGIMFATPNGTGVTKILWRKDNMSIAPDVRFDSTSADLPASTSLLNHYAYISGKSTAQSYGLDWMLIEEIRMN